MKKINSHRMFAVVLVIAAAAPLAAFAHPVQAHDRTIAARDHTPVDHSKPSGGRHDR